MGTFGDRLRREREMRGVTVAEISESTKISKRALEALEKEEFDLLPGGIFNRGFVRSYARYLGIDEEQAVADYVAASEEQPVPEDEFPLDIHQKEREGDPPLNPSRSSLPILLAVLALVLVVGGWYWVKHKPLPGTTGQNQSQASVPASSTSTTPIVSNSPQNPTPATAPAGPPAPTPAAGQTSTTVAPAESSKGDSDKQKSLDTKENPATRELKASNTFTVAIRATEEAWVSVIADGKPVIDRTLEANEQHKITAGKQVVLKTGNARGLEVSYNGKPFGPLGNKENEVRTVTFNSKGPKT